MNRILTLALTLIVTANAFAQTENIATITGKITNPIADSISISYVKNWVVYAMYTNTVALAKDGTFSLSFPVPEDYLSVDIQHGAEATELFVEPGYDLSITVDAQNFDSTLHYVGQGAAIANYMAKHVKERGLMIMTFSKVQSLAAKEPEDYLPSLNAVLNEEYEYIKVNGKDLPPSFVSYWNNAQKYLGYYFMLMYPRLHEVIKTRSYNIAEIPKENYVVSDKVPKLFSDSFIAMQQYRLYAENYYETEASKPTEDKSPMQLAIKGMPAKTLEYYLAHQHYLYLKHIAIDSTEKNISDFKKRFPNSSYTQLLEDALAQKKSMSAGQPAVDLDLITDKGEHMKLSDLKGKVVFLDFWASWCGPCIAEMPSSKEVRQHFAGKDVVFVYISVDQDEENWKKAIEKYEIEGVHILQTGGWQAPAAVKYGINGIPAYFLIDKKGNFALDNVPRPKEKDALIAEIEKLL